MRFVVISSDVIYPTGAMKDYEAKFWLPFKGIEKPVYAIPGNHDWYDALEGFNATFLTPAAARAAMHARVEADLHLTSTTDKRIDELIAKAGLAAQGIWRADRASRRGRFSRSRPSDFALIAVDTGVVRRVDPAELEWLESALAAARGKFIMVLLGHPLYALGHDQASSSERLRRHPPPASRITAFRSRWPATCTTSSITPSTTTRRPASARCTTS